MIPHSLDWSSPVLAKWLKKELDDRKLTTAQIAETMGVPEKKIQGLLAAVDPASGEAEIWTVGFTCAICVALGLPWNTAFKMLDKVPENERLRKRWQSLQEQDKKEGG